MVRGKSLFVSLLVACGSTSSSPSAPSNHTAASADCSITGTVMDTWTKEPARRALVILTGEGRPREVQHTDEAGRFTFAHAAGRTKIGVWFKDRPEEHVTASCGETRIVMKEPPNIIDI